MGGTIRKALNEVHMREMREKKKTRERERERLKVINQDNRGHTSHKRKVKFIENTNLIESGILNQEQARPSKGNVCNHHKGGSK